MYIELLRLIFEKFENNCISINEFIVEMNKLLSDIFLNINGTQSLKSVDAIKFNEESKEKIELSSFIQKNFYTDLNDGKIVPYYQPKVDINNNTICSSEALSRWVINTGEILMPNKFISILEQNGYICELDFYILNKVCKDIKEQLDIYFVNNV